MTHSEKDESRGVRTPLDRKSTVLGFEPVTLRQRYHSQPPNHPETVWNRNGQFTIINHDTFWEGNNRGERTIRHLRQLHSKAIAVHLGPEPGNAVVTRTPRVRF